MTQPIWTTPAGTLGSFTSSVLAIQLIATPVSPAASITYRLLSGVLPPGLSMNNSGNITGTPVSVSINTTSNFTIRVTDNLFSIRDRTFSITILGVSLPSFISSGLLLETYDSTWVDYPVLFSNPVQSNVIVIAVDQGALPPGLEINDEGIIRGYAKPPTAAATLSTITRTGTSTSSTGNVIQYSTIATLKLNRPVVFTGNVLGGLTAGATYYVRSIISSTSFTISTIPNGTTFVLANASGSMTITFPSYVAPIPTVRTYPFTLKLRSDMGDVSVACSIKIINQNASAIQGGPALAEGTRPPTILNTRPKTYELTNDIYYGYYRLPPVEPNVPAVIDLVKNDNFFTYKIIGYDFENAALTYQLTGSLPPGIELDTITGWITGTPSNIAELTTYSFGVRVFKTSNAGITSTTFNFSIGVSDVSDTIVEWLTPTRLGTINNGMPCTFYVSANATADLIYELTPGSSPLPPQLTLESDGTITGTVLQQHSNVLVEIDTETIYSFEVRAYANGFGGIITSTKTFEIAVFQEFGEATDTIYMKATMPDSDRNTLDALLSDNVIFPEDELYRPNDANFGKATDIRYQHLFGVNATGFSTYYSVIDNNHYWKRITLGEIKIAVARDANNEILYEVVYCQVIDEMKNQSKYPDRVELFWPRVIVSPGIAPSLRTVYPNSLKNMRIQTNDLIGTENNNKILPLWMTSQQESGNTLGYTPAWVICYALPGYGETIKNRIQSEYNLNELNFMVDRINIDKSLTYDYVSGTWAEFPGASPSPVPLDSRDFSIIFPQRDILR